jgi:hypothetical protein
LQQGSRLWLLAEVKEQVKEYFQILRAYITNHA